jgi:hypothetical protein
VALAVGASSSDAPQLALTIQGRERQGGREGGRERETERAREEREGGRESERGREGGREGGSEVGREGGRERGREKDRGIAREREAICGRATRKDVLNTWVAVQEW